MNASSHSFAPGITTLLAARRDWLKGRVVGLVSHPAALDRRGYATADLLHRSPHVQLAALFGPEHGFYGSALAGRTLRSTRHRQWGIPIHSLYGSKRKPTRQMLRGLDTLIFDLQDLGARPYTYVSTLRLVMEAAAEHGLRLIVADRPIPLPNTVDGPVTAPDCGSFVAAVPAPMHYGMTPGETARWLRNVLALDLDLWVAPMQGYQRETHRGPDWPAWIPPSQGIRSWESGWCYTTTVFAEGLPQVDHGRGTGLPFQLVGAPWMDGGALHDALNAARLPGVSFHLHPYIPARDRYGTRLLDGVRLCVTAPDRFRPILTAVTIIAALQNHHGRRRIWSHHDCRPDFFDKLFGTHAVRAALESGTPPRAIADTWRKDIRTFRRQRKEALLYHAT